MTLQNALYQATRDGLNGIMYGAVHLKKYQKKTALWYGLIITSITSRLVHRISTSEVHILTRRYVKNSKGYVNKNLKKSIQERNL